MAATKGPKKRPANSNHNPRPWEPSLHQLEWHRKWTAEAKGASQIAKEHHCKVSRQTIWEACQKVEAYYRTLTIDEVLAHRGRQVAQYETMQREALEAWIASKGKVITVTETRGEESSAITTKTEISRGDTTYANMFFSAMKGIEGLLGLKAPAKSEIQLHYPEEIEGIPPMNAFRSRSQALEAVGKILLERAADARARGA